MKLLRCHINDFGRLHNFDYTFKSGLGILIEGNEWGKSTLAVFIKAMFYGMPKKGRKVGEKNERERYAPWQGGIYGGSLEFEYLGKEYRIERTFAEKGDDVFTLYDAKTSLLSKDFGEDIGYKIFGIDDEGYERSAYLSQRKKEKGNEAIITRLTELLENVDDVNNFASAITALTNRKKYYLKSSGRSGAIPFAEDKLSEIRMKEKILCDADAEAEILKKDISEKRLRLDGRKRELREIKDKIYESVKIEKERGKAEYIEEKRGKLRSLNACIDELETETNLVKDGEIEEYSEYNKRLTEARAEITEASAKLSALYENRIYPENELRELKRLYDKISLRRVTEEVADGEKELSADNSLREKRGAAKRGKSKIPLIVAGVGAALIILGGIFMGIIKPLGLALAIVGVFAAAGGGYVYLAGLKKFKIEKDSGEELQNLFDEYRERTRALFGESLSDDKRLCEELEKTAENQKERTALSEKIAQDRVLAETFEAKLNAWKKSFGGGDAAELIAGLRMKRSKLFEVKAEAERVRRDIADYIAENGEPTEYIAEVESVDELQAKERAAEDGLRALSSEITLKESLLKEWETKAEEYGPLLEEKAYWEETLVKSRKNYDLISKTENYLNKAKERLSMSYLVKMKESYKKYADLLFTGKGETPVLNQKLEILVDAMGKHRAANSLSRGARDILDFCMQLSLVDSLFEGEKPFLILDDPFVNFDDENFLLGFNLLESLSKEYQILYLSCSESRLNKNL